MTDTSYTPLLVELARARVRALREKDSALDDEASERLMSAVTEMLELGNAAEAIAHATDELSDDPQAVESLHELVQAVVEEDESAHSEGGIPYVDRLVILPLAMTRGDSKAQTPGELKREQVEQLEKACVRLFDESGVAQLNLCGYLYDSAQLTRSSYDQLFNLMPALQDEGLTEEEVSRLRLQHEAMPVENKGVVRYLIGVLSSPSEIDSDFVFADNQAPHRAEIAATAKSLVAEAFGTKWRCLEVMELAPFFEGITMGEHFAREAAFTMDVIAGLEMSRVSPRATLAHVTMPEGDDKDQVHVQLLGMDSVPVANAYWDILEPTNPEGEVANLMLALERIGVRTRPDAAVVSGYGTA